MSHSIRKILAKKRDGNTLSEEEINFVVNSTKDGSIGKDQVAAFLMASYIKGLNVKETQVIYYTIKGKTVEDSRSLQRRSNEET